MRRCIAFVLSLALLLSLGGCMYIEPGQYGTTPLPVTLQPTPTLTPEQTPQPSPTPNEDMELAGEVLLQTQSFSVQLLQNLIATNTAENSFFSPLSLGLTLGVLYKAASGETAEQLRGIAGYTAEPEDVLAAYSILGREVESYPKAYALLSEALGFCEDPSLMNEPTLVTTPVAFGEQEGMRAINQAAAAIDESFRVLVDSTAPVEQLYLLTGAAPTINFAVPFPSTERYDAIFESPVGTFPCTMLYTEQDLGYYEDENVQICTVPMEGGKTELFLLKPTAQGQTDFGELLGQYGTDWLSADDLKPYPVRLSIPAISLNEKSDLKSSLISLGLTLPFLQGQGDISALTAKPGYPLAVNRLYSLTKLTLTEMGVNAAGTPPTTAQFTANEAGADMTLDRPFLLAVRDTATGAPIVLGWVNTMEQ